MKNISFDEKAQDYLEEVANPRPGEPDPVDRTEKPIGETDPPDPTEKPIGENFLS